MTDMTDHDRRQLREDAKAVINKTAMRSSAAVSIAQYVLATVEAPAPTLADELVHIAVHWESWDTDTITEELTAATTRAELMDRDLAEARAEVERLTAENDKLRRTDNYREFREQFLAAERLDRNPETKARVKAALNNLDQVEKVAVQKGAESNAETLDPADVKPGEAWLVECRGERRNAMKDNSLSIEWNTVNADGWPLVEDSEDITIVSRLVPAPRVITDVEELDRLPEGSIVRDCGLGDAFQKIGGKWVASRVERYEGLSSYAILPVTVLWEP